MLKSFKIQNELHLAGLAGIEVDIVLVNGERRWCYFMTPEAISASGDWLPGTKVRIHYGAEHMIVVSEISEKIINRVLDYLVANGELLACTRPIE